MIFYRQATRGLHIRSKKKNSHLAGYRSEGYNLSRNLLKALNNPAAAFLLLNHFKVSLFTILIPSPRVHTLFLRKSVMQQLKRLHLPPAHVYDIQIPPWYHYRSSPHVNSQTNTSKSLRQRLLEIKISEIASCQSICRGRGGRGNVTETRGKGK